MIVFQYVMGMLLMSGALLVFGFTPRGAGLLHWLVFAITVVLWWVATPVIAVLLVVSGVVGRRPLFSKPVGPR